MAFVSCEKQVHKEDEEVNTIFLAARANTETLEKPVISFWNQISPYQAHSLTPESYAKIDFVKAMVYRKERKTDSSLVCFESAIEKIKTDSRFLFSLYINAARDAADLNDSEKFTQLMQKTEKLANKYKDPLYKADCQGAKGLLEMNLGNFKTSRPFLIQADSILASNNITKHRDYYQYLLGYSYKKTNFYPKAYEHFNECMRLSKQNNNLHRLLYAYLNLSRLYRAENRYDKALEWQEKQVTLAEQINAPRELRGAYEGMAIIYTEMKNWEKGEEYFQKSLALARKLEIPESISVALTNIGSFFLQKGDTQKAVQYIDEACKIKKQTNMGGSSLLRTLNALGKAYKKAENITKAQEYFSQALSLSDSTESIYWKSIINKNISNLYLEKKEYPKAIEHLTNYLTLKNEYDKRRSETELQNLMVKYEAHEKDNVIKIQQQKLKEKRNIIIGAIIAFVLLFIIAMLSVLNSKIREKAIKSIYSQHIKLQDRQEVITDLIKEKAIKKAADKDNEQLTLLIKLMDEEQIFRNPELSLEILAKKMSTNVTYVSQLINKEFTCNYNTLINRYRITYCKNEIRNSAGHSILMKQIGFAAGFSSQSTFYSAFKSEVGITPLQFRKVVLIEQNSITDSNP